ncbi:MAG TPA: hypothetical protein VNQ90_05330 [Chthoniobacteraceae bacterium]|nr:hypothetical protein [Chthoniobacteraceae bacterium]
MLPPSRRHQPLHAGLTVMEMLLVVVVIAFLALLAIPVVNNVQTKGKEVSCASRMRTIGQAIRLYQADHHGFLPPNKTDPPGITADNTWVYAIHPYLNVPTGSTASVGPKMQPYLTCPSNTELFSTWAWWYSNYAVNASDTTVFGFNGQSCRPHLREPSKTMMLTETKGFGRAIRPTANGLLLLDFRHQARANVLFFDGHLEARDRKAISTSPLDPFWTGK